MKVDAKLYKCTVLTKKEVQGKEDPTKMYYRLGVWKDQEVGELRCTKEIYDQVESLHTYDLGLMFNTDYNSLQVDRVLQHYASSPFLEALMSQQAAALAAVPAEAPAAAPALEVKAEPEQAAVLDNQETEKKAETTKASKK